MTDHEPEAEDSTDPDLDPRTDRALREGILVTRARAPDRYFAFGESGRQYVVNVATGECSCPDYQHREPAGGCKHVRRVRLETGRDSVPDGVARDDALDRFLAAAIAVRENVALRADGGEVLGHEAVNAEDPDADADADERPDDCGCWSVDADLCCWPCWRAGYRSQNPQEPAADESNG